MTGAAVEGGRGEFPLVFGLDTFGDLADYELLFEKKIELFAKLLRADR